MANTHAVALRRSHTLTAPPALMIKDLDTGLSSHHTNTAWIHKGLDPLDLDLPTTSRPPLQPSVYKTTSRLLRKNSRRDNINVKTHKKRQRHFGLLVRIQQVRAHNGAVRTMKFSKDGKYLATGGQDAVVNIWRVEEEGEGVEGSSESGTDESEEREMVAVETQERKRDYLDKGRPMMRFHGHTQDVLDLAWSRNNFLLSASMDMSVMLWHPESPLCLRKFVHNSFVTTVTFHPKEENVFISGALDGRVRLWEVNEQKQLSVIESGQYVTASDISPDGKTALIGTYHGHCKFYSLYDKIADEWSLKYTTQLDVRSRKTKNNQGKKIAGFTFTTKGDKFVVSSNDSRLRVYRMDDKALVAKFSGHENEGSQLSGSISPCGKFLLCGSQDSSVVIWDMRKSSNGNEENEEMDEVDTGKRERNGRYEKFTPFEGEGVSSALFAPRLAAKRVTCLQEPKKKRKTRSAAGMIIVAASSQGYLRVFQNGVW